MQSQIRNTDIESLLAFDCLERRQIKNHWRYLLLHRQRLNGINDLRSTLILQTTAAAVLVMAAWQLVLALHVSTSPATWWLLSVAILLGGIVVLMGGWRFLKKICQARQDRVNVHTGEQLQLLFNEAALPVLIVDPVVLNILSANQAAVHLYGYSRMALCHLRLPELLATTDVATERAQSTTFALQTFVQQPRHRTGDGRIIEVEALAQPVRFAGQEAVMLLLRDVTAQKGLEQQVATLSQQLADHATELQQRERSAVMQASLDPLTNLPNRVLFHERLRRAMAHANRNKALMAVLYIDLDRFKHVNDTFGHEAGDLVLKEVASRLKGSVRETDTVARLSGDEFTVLLEGVGTLANTAQIADKILTSLAEPIVTSHAEIFIRGSIGIMSYPCQSVETVGSILAKADSAMYYAKSQGRNNHQHYASHMDTRSFRRFSLESHLRRAMERHELTLHYQPQVDIASNRITGAEALLRWNNYDLGQVSPAEFIPIAEDTGLIVPIGSWVIDQACRMKREMDKAGFALERIAVNVSARQFRDAGFLNRVEEALLNSGIGRDCLELEITEGALMEDTRASTRILERLQEMGVLVSIDDFGTGYSSLSYLKHFPLDMLKIDASFIRDLTVNQKDASITRAIISLAQSLDLKVMAEGVETREQLDFLRLNGCNGMQGFLVSRALPEREFNTLVQGWRAPALA